MSTNIAIDNRPCELSRITTYDVTHSITSNYIFANPTFDPIFNSMYLATYIACWEATNIAIAAFDRRQNDAATGDINVY